MSDLDQTNAPANLPFAWWNTKVAPPSTSSVADRGHKAAAIDVVQALIRGQGCLLVALAEVRRQDVLAWVPADSRTVWESLTDTSDEHHDFDVALIFDRTHLVLLDHRWVRDRYAGQAVRAGLVATFSFTDDSADLIVAAAHWRSDSGGTEDASARRTTAATALRDAIADSLRSVGSTTPVLILGDFNAEPFADQFGGSLPTARSRAEVQRHHPRTPSDLLFYNAAWRWLGERYPWDSDRRPPSLAGTYRKEGSSVPTVWRTVDQVLVSPSLLGTTTWSLDERHLRVFDDGCVYDPTAGRPRAPFDHLPIVGQLRRPASPSTTGARQP